MASSGKAAPAELTRRVAARLATLPIAGSSLCLGYSGGLDSTVLLHLLAGLRAELGLSLSAVHVHHGLSPRADAWQAHCEAACVALDVPLRVARVRVEPDGRGLEAAARAARYGVFEGLDADYLALAHQRDDQAETLLLNLLRGAGVLGLAAMPYARPLARGRPVLLRPLLDASRAELLDYARARGLAWVEDDSNLNPGYTRNFLRHRLLPLLEARQPAIRPVLARTAGHLAEAAALLDDLARLDLGKEDSGEARAYPTLDLARLVALSRPRAANLLRHHLHRLGLAALSTAALDELLDQLLGATPDAGILWRQGGPSPSGGPVLRVWRGRLHVDRHAAPPPEERVWRGEEELDWGGGRVRFVPTRGTGLSRARLEETLARARDSVMLRPRRGGERLCPHPARPRRCLKKLWQEAGVPPWERPRLPLLWLGGTLAWVAGLGVDATLQAQPDEPGWLISWQPPAPPPP